MLKGTEVLTTDVDYTERGPFNDPTLSFTTTGRS